METYTLTFLVRSPSERVRLKKKRHGLWFVASQWKKGRQNKKRKKGSKDHSRWESGGVSRPSLIPRGTTRKDFPRLLLLLASKGIGIGFLVPEVVSKGASDTPKSYVCDLSERRQVAATLGVLAISRSMSLPQRNSSSCLYRKRG
ncbi:hypothetical protein RUM44_002892 [Polyplax serrata]|uniref:Uncharacterized protein n=1 Tax=Polyplax serrata TaxID=468196 RepID=A0ABR1AYR7_POLSC